MSPLNDVLILDFETASTLDLRKTGVDKYSKHPDTRVLCMGYAFNGEAAQIWTPGTLFPDRIKKHVGLNLPVIAHNATFERYIWNNVLARGWSIFPALSAKQLTQDTMIRAAYWGLPMGLDAVAEALSLPFGKDPGGRKVMLQCTKPRDERDDGTFVWWHETDISKYEALQRYCLMDVELERVIHQLLPPLPADTAEELIFDAEMNDNGLCIDASRVALLESISKRETARLDKHMFTITAGQVRDTRDLKGLTEYLKAHNIYTGTLDKGAVSSLLKRQIPNLVRLALELRQEAAKTSVAKLKAMQNAMADDDHVRQVFQFYGATRTGRYAGRLIQPQNFPRPVLKRPELEYALDQIIAGREVGAVHAQAASNLTIVSSALRSCIVAKPGEELVVVDFAQIEARVLAWLAEQHDILQVFETGQDVYMYDAKSIGSKDRQLGKVCRLGLGYGMGPSRFIETALTYGLALETMFAESVVKDWRTANRMIVNLWYNTGDVIKDAIMGSRGQWLKIRDNLHCGCFYHDATGVWCLLIRLPSGRMLVYREPEWDQLEGVSYMGVDQYTKAWTRIRSYGAKFIENIVQAIARDLMLWVMLRVKKDFPGWVRAVGTVHDEGIWSVPLGNGAATLTTIESLIEAAPHTEPWIAGLPMKGEGFVAERYGK